MNPWLKRIFLLLTIGGGFLGTVMTLLMLGKSELRIVEVPLALAILGSFVFGIFSGWTLIQNEDKGLRAVKWFFAIQIPFFSSPFFGYWMMSGFGFRAIISDGGFTVTAKLGSDMRLSIMQGFPWAVGVNVGALILFLLCRDIEHKRSLLSAVPDHSIEPTR